MASDSISTAPITATCGRRALLISAAKFGVTVLAWYLSEASSGGHGYRAVEMDEGSIFALGLHDETERDYYAALVVTEVAAEHFDRDGISETGATFVRETDFQESYLALIQVAALNSTMRFEVVDIHESDGNLTVTVAIRDDPRTQRIE